MTEVIDWLTLFANISIVALLVNSQSPATSTTAPRPMENFIDWYIVAFWVMVLLMVVSMAVFDSAIDLL